jgi:hypothetical protein
MFHGMTFLFLLGGIEMEENNLGNDHHMVSDAACFALCGMVLIVG